MYSWEGKGEEEKGIEKSTGTVRVEVDPKYYRPTEVVSSYYNWECMISSPSWSPSLSLSLSMAGLSSGRLLKGKERFGLGTKDNIYGKNSLTNLRPVCEILTRCA